MTHDNNDDYIVDLMSLFLILTPQEFKFAKLCFKRDPDFPGVNIGIDVPNTKRREKLLTSILDKIEETYNIRGRIGNIGRKIIYVRLYDQN